MVKWDVERILKDTWVNWFGIHSNKKIDALSIKVESNNILGYPLTSTHVLCIMACSPINNHEYTHTHTHTE